MAKSTALARFTPRPIVINVPRRRGRVRRAAGAAVRYVRSRGRGAARRALPLVGGVLGGAGVGWLVGSGKLDFLPEIGGSRMVTLGIAGYAATRMSSNPHIRAAGYAALVSAAFDFGRAQAGGTHGDDDWGWNS